MCSDPPKESKNGCGIFRYSMVRPGSEVELSQLEGLVLICSIVLCMTIIVMHLHSLIGLTYYDFKASDCIVWQDLLFSFDHLEWPILLFTRLRPVLLTLDSTSLLTVGEHDYCRGSLLPHHPPEVNHSMGERT